MTTLTALLAETTTGTGFGFCIGQFCNGPDVEPEDMVTCWRCRLLHDLRKAMAAEPDPLPRQDLRALLDYDWSSEERDYEANPDDRHVFLAMQRLSDWLDDSPSTPGVPGTETIVFHWSRHHGDCLDCGRPAAFVSTDAYGQSVLGSNDQPKLCSVCAATHAADGETIAWIANPYDEPVDLA